ncbi:MAG: chromate transporter [Firmicutes bacterium HGW-Firmicutes-13]|nr:MAG: chromate transporter [Firmicutes bacterium HGW-Firmicutes-13]
MLLTIFLIFFKIGAFTFGGGLAMLPIVKRELVEKRKWVSPQEFVDILAVSMTSPGAIIINTSVNIGYRKKGIPGSIAAVLGASLPSFLVILSIAIFFLEFQELPKIESIFNGIRPAVGAFIAAAIFKIGGPLFKSLKSVAFIIFFLFLSLVFDFHPIFIIVLGGLAGLAFFKKDME